MNLGGIAAPLLSTYSSPHAAPWFLIRVLKATESSWRARLLDFPYPLPVLFMYAAVGSSSPSSIHSLSMRSFTHSYLVFATQASAKQGGIPDG